MRWLNDAIKRFILSKRKICVTGERVVIPDMVILPMPKWSNFNFRKYSLIERAGVAPLPAKPWTDADRKSLRDGFAIGYLLCSDCIEEFKDDIFDYVMGDAHCDKHGDFCFSRSRLKELCHRCAAEKNICQKCGGAMK